MTDVQTVTLADLARGAAGELFAEELQRVAENIVDINTDRHTARKIVMLFEFRPEDDARREVLVSVSVRSTVAPLMKVKTRIYMRPGRSGGVEIAEQNANQGDLFAAPSVVPAFAGGVSHGEAK